MSRQAAARIEQPETTTVRKIDPEISEVMSLIGAMERLAGELSAARGELLAEAETAETPPEAEEAEEAAAGEETKAPETGAASSDG